MEKQTIEQVLRNIDDIQSSVREATSMIKHSTPITNYADAPQQDIRDLIIIGAITGKNLLLNGSAGIAKTHLGLTALAGLYGNENTTCLQIDPSLEKENLFNIDGGKLQNGLLSEAIIDSKLITCPGVLLDEINRAPGAIRNVLQGYLNNQAITPAGGEIREIGVELSNGDRYQFKIGTCNEGKKYGESTFKMDPAFRRRWQIELPIDLFSPTDYDLNERRKARRIGSGLFVPKSVGVQDKVFATYSFISSLDFNPLAEEFISYLGRMNNCSNPKSFFKTKNEKGFSIDRCNGCHARGLAGTQNFCGNVYAPESPQEDIEAVAKGFALIRNHHEAAVNGNLPETIEVSFEDVLQAFPFVCSTKMSFDSAWLEKYFNSGEPFEATRALGINIEQKIKSKIKKLEELMVKKEFTQDELEIIKKYSLEDPWSFGLRDCDNNPVVYKSLR
ncbi:MAG: AAA family ATPase [Nanoarchaeota archaeon]|nr:AAA family ATPase [Nanoarchaeota archaeon]